MKDIVVTTPKTRMEAAAREAKEARETIQAGGESWYFRNLGKGKPKHFFEGGRVYYVEDGWVRGFAKCFALTPDPKGKTCVTTGQRFKPGWYACMDPKSWTWILPIEMEGFQGWRYWKVHPRKISPAGGWLAPKPDVPE